MFTLLLKEAGLSQANFAARLGLHRNTVNAWTTKRTEIPRYALTYLYLLIESKKPCAKCAKIKEMINENV